MYRYGAELKPKIARMPVEMYVLYAVLQTVGSHLLLHTTVLLYSLSVVAALALKFFYIACGSRFPIDCQPINSFLVGAEAARNLYATNFVMFCYSGLAVGVSWVVERWCREVFQSTVASEARERVYDAFPFMRMAGTAGEITDPFQARAQYQARRR